MQEHLHFTNKNKLLKTIKKQAKKPVFWCRKPDLNRHEIALEGF